MNLALENLAVTLDEFELDVNIAIFADATGIFGPSGAGKTTLMETIAGLRKPRTGRIVLNGRVLHGGGRHVPPRERRIGYVPQDETLFPHLSVKANALYGARNGGASRLDQLAELMDLSLLLDRSVANLSGGERRRVALARALMTDPDVLLLDEPLSGLDAALKNRTIELLRDIRTRLHTPMLFVTHDAGELHAICDQAVVLDRGRVIAQGSPSEVL